MAEQQKKNDSQNGEFKISPLGFDKTEVMAYIVQHNKDMKALKTEVEQLKKELEAAQNAGPSEDVTAEIEKKKAELDAQILESRKQILDERRKLAQTEKQLHVLQDQFVALQDEYKEYKKRADAKLKKAKKSGGSASVDPEQLAEISTKANADANAVIDDAKKKADEIITAAKAYFTDTVQKTYDYKQTVLAKADEYTADFKAGGNNGAIAATVNVFELLSAVAQEINDAVNSAIDSASEKAKQVTEAPATETDEAKLAEDEAIANARAELENIEGLDNSMLDGYKAIDVEPYSFELKVVLPEGEAEADEDDEDDFPIADENGLLSSFAVISSDSMSSGSTDDMSASFAEEDVVVADDDIADLLAAAPAPAPAKIAAPAKKADDDFADLLAQEPAQKADDDFSDLLAAPAPALAKKAEPAFKDENDISDLLAAPVSDTFKPAAAQPADDIAGDLADLMADSPAEEADFSALMADSIDDGMSDLMAATPEEPKATDDFSDLLTEAPVSVPTRPATSRPVRNEEKQEFKRAHSREGIGSNGEKLNESGKMGVAGKEEIPNDPWKDLEAQMNGLNITSAPAKKSMPDDDDGMTSSFDDAPVAQTSAADDKIDMSDYSGMLGINDNMNTSAAQFDSSWELKMMEGITSDDEDDEMSSDNTGFFDL